MRDSGGRAAVFAPLDLGRRADAVVRRLSEGIRLGLLRPGEQLPSESELAESFGVAPVTVREALTILRGQQLVVTRRGRTGGSFVRDVRGGAADVLRERLREVAPSQLRDLADHYVAVFGTSAHLAAERAGAQRRARCSPRAWRSCGGRRTRTRGGGRSRGSTSASPPRRSRPG